jgi:hypothetical protein
MKNNNDISIREARATKLHRTMHTDILVIPEVTAANMQRVANRPPRPKRRRNWAKKIQNDNFLMNL